MEIKLNVPRNTYAQPTEPRQDVVQSIVNAFLDNIKYRNNVFHPVNDGYPRMKTIYIMVEKTRGGERHRFASTCNEGDTGAHYIRFYGCEMKAAMKALMLAGWHILEIYEYRTWRGYVCCEKPHCDCYGRGCREIQADEFNDFID